MSTLNNTFEGGTNTAVVTSGNSGGASGDAFTAVETNVVFSSVRAAHGSLSALIANPGVATATMRWALTTAATVAARSYIYLSALTAADLDFIRLSHVGDTSAVFARGIGDGRLRLTILGAAVPWTSTNTIPINQWVRIELRVTAGTSTTTGTARLAYYLGDSTTPVEDSGVITGLNTAGGTAGFINARIGKANGASYTGNINTDDPAVYTDADAPGFVGPVANAAPVVTASANQNVAAGATASMTFTATDSDGTIASRSTTFDYPTSGAPALTGGTTATPSFTAGAAGSLYIVKQTVTDNQGASSSATTEIRVPDSNATDLGLPLPIAAVGGFTRVGSAANDGAALNDTDDTTYLESASVSATVQTMRIRCRPLTTRAGFAVTARLSKSDTGSLTCGFRLMEGTTQRQAWTGIPVGQAATDIGFTVTSPASIVDWGNLYLEVTAAA